MSNLKICVFCNKRPINKNNEHVIPKWLIDITGGKNRLISIKGVGTKTSSLGFYSFKFPACSTCNEKFSKLEDKTKPIILKLVNKERVTSYEFEILMDWLDKVRIGLWLGSLMFSNNPIEIEPHFGIATRLKKDRMLIIATTSEPSRRLNFTGFMDPLFHHLPCFFMLYINGISLISLSSDYLLCNEIPLPNFSRIYEQKDGTHNVKMQPNTKQGISIPYLGKRFAVIVQINYPTQINPNELDSRYFQYINNDMKSSKILLIDKKNLLIYPDKASMAWKAEEFKKRDELVNESTMKFSRLRNWIAIKIIKSSKNADLNKSYEKLLKANILGENY